MNGLTKPNVQDRLEDATHKIEELRQICGVPSISIGILHFGEVVLRKSFGFCDIENRVLANSDTMYLLSSLSKGFVSAAAGIAVDDGKIDWLTPLSKVLPDFSPIGDSEITKNGTMRDFLRHSSGLSCPQILMLGPRGTLINDEDDFIRLMNAAPTKDEDGQRYNRWWIYNNCGYGLVALALQKLYKQRYTDLIQHRILDPLKMTRTTICSKEYRTDDNIAHPYARMKNGAFERLSSDSWTYEDHTPALAAMGMRSSINDILTWAAAIMSAERDEIETKSNLTLKTEPDNCLRNIARTRQGSWTRPCSGRDIHPNETAYGMGWYRTWTPTSMLGFLSYNDMTRDNKEQTFLQYTLGTSSPRKLVIAHNGVFCGSSGALYTFPETKSAIVAFANSSQDADAAEFAVQILLQALFDLQPPVDLLALACKEVELRRLEFENKLRLEWKKGRDASAINILSDDVVGEYEGFATRLSIFSSPETKALYLQFNGDINSACDLQIYEKDTYSFFPATRDEWLEKSMTDWNHHELALLCFHRDLEDIVDGVFWRWDHEGQASFFAKIDRRN